MSTIEQIAAIYFITQAVYAIFAFARDIVMLSRYRRDKILLDNQDKYIEEKNEWKATAELCEGHIAFLIDKNNELKEKLEKTAQAMGK